MVGVPGLFGRYRVVWGGFCQHPGAPGAGAGPSRGGGSEAASCKCQLFQEEIGLPSQMSAGMGLGTCTR